ncbi:ribonuclease R [Sedimenticola hydrogenitrophicus]|uniref:ribonuclease R n=1 Tax=Sedimenticola hydrogenitrophicus TaxID=2967975 RepID=UPI0023B1E7C5|nr:ribonuclease R [Sedimenticola hydrogenitrophicus]
MSRSSGNKTVKNADPHLVREAKKYANPIPSREFILQHLESAGVPMAQQELAAQLALQGEDDLEALRRRLNAMERDGQLVRNRNGALCIVNSKDLIAGRVIGHPDGFGFLRPDEGGDDLFVSPRQMRQLLHNDRAVVRVVGLDRRGRKEAAVVEVLERGNQLVVGRLYMDRGVGFVVPDNKRLHQDIVIPEDDFNGATHGQMVVAEIVQQPNKHMQPIGRIKDVLGEHMAPGMETDVAIWTHQLPLEWPEEVQQEIVHLGREVEEQSKQGRVDLRHLPLVTIDGADARDFDDAVYCEAKPKGWRLLVCIADVSSYVQPGSALDREAKSRGNSVYFPDRVIPMLPEVLSNGLCSLNPAVDRLCMTCELYVNQEGVVTRSRFYEAVMRSQARLTYDQVADMLIEGEPGLCATHADLLPHLHQLYALFQVLRDARSTLGAIDFDTTETRILFNAEHKVERIVPVQRNDAHRLIEECMLAANVAAARFLLRKKLPALYRNHDGPQAEKLLDLKEFLGELGLRLPGGVKPQTSDYADLLSEVRGRPDSHLIQTVLLRSLSQAVYSAENQGHFGLSFAAYAHFTSPIRRYPDLIVHRAIRHLLKGGTLEDFDYTQTELQGLGEHCSATERRADEATRDVTSWLKCEYMMDKIGEEFVGIITSVTSFGIFVELDEIYVDGLVHITALDNDYYHFDPVGHRLTGERSGMVYRLGDQVKIKVAAVNLDERKIDFMLLEAVSAKAKSRRSKKGPAAPADGGRSREDSGKTRRKKAQGPSAAPAAKGEKPASGKGDEQAPGKKRRSARRRGKPKAE